MTKSATGKLQEIVEKKKKESLLNNKPSLEVKPKRWIQYLSPRFWKMKKALELMSSTKEFKEEIDTRVTEELLENALYGTPVQ
jgi:hypothetical protein